MSHMHTPLTGHRSDHSRSSSERLNDAEFRRKRAKRHIELSIMEGLKSDAVDGERKLVV